MSADQLKNPGVGRQQKPGKHTGDPIKDQISRRCKREQKQRTEELYSFRVEGQGQNGSIVENEQGEMNSKQRSKEKKGKWEQEHSIQKPWALEPCLFYVRC